MSRTSKGTSYEREVEKILQDKGYITERAYKKTIWAYNKKKRCYGPISISHDFFGSWDIIAKLKSKDRPTLWVQVTVWEEVSHKRGELMTFPWSPKHDECVIYARMRNKGRPHFRVLYAADNYQWNEEIEYVRKN